MSWVSLRWGALLLTSAAIFLAGYKVAEWRINASRLQETRAALQELEALRNMEQQFQRDLFIESTKLSQQLLKEEQERRVIVTETIKKVPIYVQDNRACDFSADAIRLRNEIVRSYRNN